MKLIGVSDPHITSKIPRGRIGNPLIDAKRKLNYIFSYASEINADILFAGDLFNTPRDITALFMFLSITSKYPNVKVFTIYGQHDMYMRNKDVLTNLAILSRAGVITILDNVPYHYHNTKNNIHIYGCSWNEKIPSISNPDDINILAIHAPIYHKELFPGHKYKGVDRFVTKYKYFDFIIVGDIHRKFKFSYKQDRYGNIGIIANTGPMMRLETSEYIMNHKPNFIVYDPQSGHTETVLIPCKDASDVLSESATKEVIDGDYIGISDAFLNEREVEDINIIFVVKELLERSKNKGVIKVLSNIIEEINPDDF